MYTDRHRIGSTATSVIGLRLIGLRLIGLRLIGLRLIGLRLIRLRLIGLGVLAFIGCTSSSSSPDAASSRDGGGAFDGCSSGSSCPDAARMDGGAFDGSSEAGQDASSPEDASFDAWPPLPHRCPDDPIPGFRELDGGWFRPCNCFDGDPLRMVPTIHGDNGVRTVLFDCAWPEGMIQHDVMVQSGTILFNSVACEHAGELGVGAGYFPEPYYLDFGVYHPDAFWPASVPGDHVCVPSECVFAVPGEPARCSDDCVPNNPETLEIYRTTFRVDRRACDAGAGDAS